MMYNRWQYEVNWHFTGPGSEHPRLHLCHCADCSMFWKYKHGEDQRRTVVHFILLKGRFLPPLCCYKETWECRSTHNTGVRVCACVHGCARVHTYPCSRATLHFTLFLPFFFFFCSLKPLPSLSGKRLLWNPFYINYFLFPACPVTNLGSWRWITLHSKSALNTEFKILFILLLVNVSPYSLSRHFHLALSIDWIKTQNIYTTRRLGEDFSQFEERVLETGCMSSA